MRRRRDRWYWLRLLCLMVAAIVIPIVAVPVAMGAKAMWSLTHPGCNDDGATPAAYGLKYSEISIPASSGSTYRGFFIPGTNGASIIVPPPYNSGRGNMLPETAWLAQAGYNVITYESRLCAGQPSISLGYREVDDVGDVLAYLRQNRDKLSGVDLTRVALHGFSSAGATSIMATARYQDIKAALAEGGYQNMDAQIGIGNVHSAFEGLMLIGAQGAYRVATGLDSSLLSPVDAMRHIPPRPIFLVYGSREVSLDGAKQELAAAQLVGGDSAAHLWIVPNSGHGGYIGAVGLDEYKRWVLPFYDCALLNQCEKWDMLWKNA